MLGGHTVRVFEYNRVIFKPYYELDYDLATFNGTDENFESSAAPFNGRLETRVISDFGNFTASFPPQKNETIVGMYNSKRNVNQISIPPSNVIYASSGTGGKIAIGSYITFGLVVEAGEDYYSTELVDVSAPSHINPTVSGRLIIPDVCDIQHVNRVLVRPSPTMQAWSSNT